MLNSSIYRLKDSEAKNVLESVVCYQNIQHIVCLSKCIEQDVHWTVLQYGQSQLVESV